MYMYTYNSNKMNGTFENPQCEDAEDRLVTTDQQKKESQVCCLSCLYISNSYNKCTRGKCFAPIFFSTLCSWQQKKLCVPQTETVVEHITEILSSIGQIGLTMLLFLFRPFKGPGTYTTLLLLLLLFVGLGTWWRRSSVTVTATLTVLVLLCLGSDMSVTLQIRSCKEESGLERRK